MVGTFAEVFCGEVAGNMIAFKVCTESLRAHHFALALFYGAV